MPKNNCCRLCQESYKVILNCIPSKCFNFENNIPVNNFCDKAYIEKDGLRYFLNKPCNICTKETICNYFKRAKVK